MRVTPIEAVLGLALVAALLPACSSQYVYAGLQANQRNRCLEEPDSDTRERCLAATDRSYDEYERQRVTP